MQELMLEHYWMAGIMLVMALFGIAAIAGYYYAQRQDVEPDD